MTTIRPYLHAFLLLTAMLFGISTTLVARADNFEIKNIQRTVKRSDSPSSVLNFPVVNGQNQTAANRINHAMLESLFGDGWLGSNMVPPINPKDYLKVVPEDDLFRLGYLEYRILRNDNSVFSIKFDFEGCGAYCEHSDLPLAFDATTGRRLQSMDLFSAAGRKALFRTIKTQNQAAIRKQLALSQRAKPTKNRTQDELDQATSMYQSCLQESSYDYTGAMHFLSDAIVFIHGRCSNHAMLALDDLGDLRNRFTYERLSPWLTAYGRALLLGEGAGGQPTWPFGQVFHGTMGDKTPITMYLRDRDDDITDKYSAVSGHYFYDRYRKPIALNGNWSNGKLSMKESDGDKPPHATITLIVNPNGLQGEWKSIDGKKTLRVKFEP